MPKTSDQLKIYMLAGEPSGDMHGKNLATSLLKQNPEIQFRGMGGDGLAEAGMHIVKHIRETSFMGWREVIQNLGKIRKMFRLIENDIMDWKPDAVILIDYPGFNLRMAKFLKERGIKTIYYISPQVWAWKQKRVEKVRKYVDRMLVILPFEKDFYGKHRVDVDFVGHPLLDEISSRDFHPKELKKEFGMDERPVLALLPGSRKQEISRMLPVMLKAARQFPGYQAVIAGAPNQELAYYREFDSAIPVVTGKTYELLNLASAACVTSGTATLETALFKVPEVVCYAGPWLSYQLAKRLVKVKYISLVNLIMDREVVKELIQQELNVKKLVRELKKLLEDQAHRQQLLQDYEALRHKLGDEGASARAAELILKMVWK